MKKTIWVMLAGLALILQISCTSKSVEGNLDSQVDLRYGHSITIAEEGLTIEFSGEVEDGRCPTNAYCFWVGQALVHFTIEKSGGQKLVAEAITSPDSLFSRPALYPGYRITVLQLGPYPEDFDQPIDDSLRVVTIRVESVVGGLY